MIVSCDAERWEYVGHILEKNRGLDGPCGKVYDDATHYTICPHEPLPTKQSLEEMERILAEADSYDVARGFSAKVQDLSTEA